MSGSVDVNLLNPFVQAVLDCLTQMAGLNPQRKRLFVKESPSDARRCQWHYWDEQRRDG